MHSICLCLIMLLSLTGCTSVEPAPKPEDDPIPEINVWIAEREVLVRMDVESYVAGVVAGEIPSHWPMEALKAQAILARTFVMKFLSEKESRYPGADISTDITEAQAYDAAAVDSRILTAVHETRGMILRAADGSIPYAWFHAHSGGSTALAAESLDWQGVEPAYTRVTEGLDSPAAPPSAAIWSASFTSEEFLAACADAGYPLTTCRQVTIAEIGPSGRTVTMNVDGTLVNAARLRISLGSTRMRSTLLTELASENGIIRMSGRGYGHGVGMPQWGARGLAEAGWTVDEIVLHYYKGLHIEHAW